MKRLRLCRSRPAAAVQRHRGCDPDSLDLTPRLAKLRDNCWVRDGDHLSIHSELFGPIFGLEDDVLLLVVAVSKGLCMEVRCGADELE